MELLQLKYFQTVARLENVTRASEELHVAQPALSKTIALLEKDLGVLLFDRRGKYIHLNHYGKTFLKKVEQALSALEDGKNELKELSGNHHGEVKLAVLAASNLLPDLMTSFRREYPKIRFNLIQHFSCSAAKADYDLCIESKAVGKEEADVIPLLTEEIFLAVPVTHRLAERTRIHLSEVSDDDFICLNPGKQLREITDGFCKTVGFSPNVIFESDDPATVRGLTKAGLGVAFIPEMTWGGISEESMVLLHIEEPICKRTIQLRYKAEQHLPLSARIFSQFTIDYFARHFYKL